VPANMNGTAPEQQQDDSPDDPAPTPDDSEAQA